MLQITASRNLRAAALMAVVFKAAMWGLSMPLTKSLVDVYEPCTLGALRLVIALCVFLPILLVQGKRPLISRETVILGVIVGAQYAFLTVALIAGIALAAVALGARL